jgi:hypothetical protein
MRILAKNFSGRTLVVQLIFVAIIAASIAGVARHSLLLEWSALVATLCLVVLDPLTSRDRVRATPPAAPADDSAIKGKFFNPSKTAQPTPESGALITSKV